MIRLPRLHSASLLVALTCLHASAGEALENTVVQWLALRSDAARLDREGRQEAAAFEREHTRLAAACDELANRLRLDRDAAATAGAAAARATLAYTNALDRLADTEAALAAAWSRVPAPHRRPTPPTADTPERRAAAVRHGVGALASLHRQMLRGRDLVDTTAGRRLCDVLTLGLSAACAVSDDGTFAAIAVPGADGRWAWTEQPTLAKAIRAAVAAHAREGLAAVPVAALGKTASLPEAGIPRSEVSPADGDTPQRAERHAEPPAPPTESAPAPQSGPSPPPTPPDVAQTTDPRAPLAIAQADLDAARRDVAALEEWLAAQRAVHADQLAALQTKEAALAREAAAATTERRDAEEAQREGRRLERLAGVLDVAGERARLDRLRAIREPTTAIGPDGIEFVGAALDLGPLAVFEAADGGSVGTLPRGGPDGLPASLEAPRTADEDGALRAILAGTAAFLPVRFAPREAGPPRLPFREQLRQGGPVLVPLAAVALCALGLVLFKCVDLRRLRHDPVAVERALAALRQGLVPETMNLARQPVLGVLRALAGRRGATRAELDETAHEHLVALLPRLERGLGGIAVLGGVAPLLGLLGTVTGMIRTFRGVTQAGSTNIRLLSGGISEALITTEVGLAIAIPCLLVHAWLARRVQARLGAYEDIAETAVEVLLARRNETGRRTDVAQVEA